MTLEDATVTLVHHDWVGDEAELPGPWRELGRLLRRARRRWLRTLLYALGCTALALAAGARVRPVYVSRIVVRATASPTRTPRAEPPAPRDVVARAASVSPRLAAARGDLAIERWPEGRVAVTLRGSDAQQVHDDLIALGRLLVDARPDPRSHAPLRWELVDRGRVAAAWPDRGTLLVGLGVLAFLVALPLCAVAVGAFDERIYELVDVERLGLSSLGAVRRFEGDNAGALAVRLARGRIDPS
ncbi:MAG: hypothetical protein ACXVCV_14935 [Polyangia bacterium]